MSKEAEVISRIKERVISIMLEEADIHKNDIRFVDVTNGNPPTDHRTIVISFSGKIKESLKLIII